MDSKETYYFGKRSCKIYREIKKTIATGITGINRKIESINNYNRECKSFKKYISV